MVFTQTQTILFRHCDPAGIVFYPRFFEMANDMVEAFFAHLGTPFADLHRKAAVPTAEISATFHTPARLGEVLELRLSLSRLGRTSLGYRIRAGAFTVTATLVHTGADLRPAPWPDALRARLADYLEEEPTP